MEFLLGRLSSVTMHLLVTRGSCRGWSVPLEWHWFDCYNAGPSWGDQNLRWDSGTWIVWSPKVGEVCIQIVIWVQMDFYVVDYFLENACRVAMYICLGLGVLDRRWVRVGWWGKWSRPTISFLLRAGSDTLPTPLNPNRWKLQTEAHCDLCGSNASSGLYNTQARG